MKQTPKVKKKTNQHKIIVRAEHWEEKEKNTRRYNERIRIKKELHVFCWENIGIRA